MPVSRIFFLLLHRLRRESPRADVHRPDVSLVLATAQIIGATPARSVAVGVLLISDY